MLHRRVSVVKFVHSCFLTKCLLNSSCKGSLCFNEVDEHEVHHQIFWFSDLKLESNHFSFLKRSKNWLWMKTKWNSYFASVARKEVPHTWTAPSWRGSSTSGRQQHPLIHKYCFSRETDIWLKRTDTWKPKLIWERKLSCPHWFVKPPSFSLLTGIDTKPVTYNKLSTSLWKEAFRLQISFCTTCKLALSWFKLNSLFLFNEKKNSLLHLTLHQMNINLVHKSSSLKVSSGRKGCWSSQGEIYQYDRKTKVFNSLEAQMYETWYYSLTVTT